MSESHQGKATIEQFLKETEEKRREAFKKALETEDNLLESDIMSPLLEALIQRFHPDLRQRFYQLLTWGFEPQQVLTMNHNSSPMEMAQRVAIELNRNPDLKKRVLTYLVNNPTLSLAD